MPDLPRATVFKPPKILSGIVRARTSLQAAPPGIALRPISGISEATEPRWYQVTFDKPYLYKPTVLANAEAREGRISEGKMTLPGFKPPEFPMLAAKIPSLPGFPMLSAKTPPAPTLSKLSSAMGDLSYNAWKKLFTRVDEKQREVFTWGFPPGAKEIRENISKVIWWVWSVLKDDFWMLGGKPAAELDRVVNSVIPDQVKAYRDQLEASFKAYQASFEKSVSQWNVNMRDSLEATFKAYHASFERAVSQWNANISAAAGQLKDLAQQAMNSSMPQLYDHMGLIDTMKMTPVSIRNVTTRGFQFLGLKGRITVHWVAFGLVKAGEEAPPTKPIEPEPEPERFKLPSRPPFPWE